MKRERRFENIIAQLNNDSLVKNSFDSTKDYHVFLRAKQIFLCIHRESNEMFAINIDTRNLVRLLSPEGELADITEEFFSDEAREKYHSMLDNCGDSGIKKSMWIHDYDEKIAVIEFTAYDEENDTELNIYGKIDTKFQIVEKFNYKTYSTELPQRIPGVGRGVYPIEKISIKQPDVKFSLWRFVHVVYNYAIDLIDEVNQIEHLYKKKCKYIPFDVFTEQKGIHNYLILTIEPSLLAEGAYFLNIEILFRSGIVTTKEIRYCLNIQDLRQVLVDKKSFNEEVMKCLDIILENKYNDVL